MIYFFHLKGTLDFEYTCVPFFTVTSGRTRIKFAVHLQKLTRLLLQMFCVLTLSMTSS